MKKLAAITLAGILSVSMLTACGGDKKNEEAEPTEVVTTAAPTEEATAEEATEAPAEETAATEEAAEEDVQAKADDVTPEETEEEPELQTAEEAANDKVTIQNELDSIEALIAEGLYDDAEMQARALLTKNLTDADKALIQEYYARLQSYLGR